MAELQELLDANTCVPQHFHDRPDPEGMLLLDAQVAVFAGGIVGPDPVDPGPPDEDRPLPDEGLSRLRVPRRVEQLLGVLAVPVEGVDQCGERGQPLTGAGVHAGLALTGDLPQDSLLGADRAGRHPRRPAARLFDRPMGQVQVEGPHRGQTLAVAQPHDDNLGADTGLGPHLSGCGLQALLPPADDVGGQVQTADAGMVPFDVGPEAVAQQVGQRFQAVVVQRGLPLFEVVDQQVPHRAAGQVVTIDHLLGGALAGRAQLPQHRRRLRAEDPRLVQGPIEQGGAIADPAVHGGLGVEQLNHVPDGDLADGAALGRHDHRAAVQHPGPDPFSHIGFRSVCACSRANPSGSR